jgi:hypothetical protein
MRIRHSLLASPTNSTINTIPFSLSRMCRLLSLVVLTCCCPVVLLASTYYLAPASQGGNDRNNGYGTDTPWLSPNHSLRCGDVIIALASTSYDSSNFNSGHWGNVSCPDNNNVAWLKCATFDGCKLYSGSEGIYVDHSYWGVQGWEVNVWGGNDGFCFGAAPSYTNWVNIHHIIFANNIANGCKGGGFVSFNLDSEGVDYFNVVGNIVYDTIQGSDECYNGISVYQPVQADWASGTHIYVAGNFAWNNYEANPCGGVQAWGGDGIMFDTFDGSHGMPYTYQSQAVAENNISIGNGGHGIEVQNNVAGSNHALIILSNNTTWGNEQMSNQQYNHLCAEVLLNSAYNVQEYWNLVATKDQTACADNPTYSFSAYQVDSSDWVYSNLAFAYNGQFTYFYWGTDFSYSSSNVLGVNPYLSDPYVPGPPSCGWAANVTNCMGWVADNFKPTNDSATWAGRQTPSNSPQSDPLFPTWVCNAELPDGLIIKPC